MNRKGWLLGSAALAAGVSAAVLLRRAEGMDLHGKVVLITGGSRGLGLALARTFAGKGARLALCARSAEELDAARRDLAGRGAEAITMTCDVSDREQVDRLVRQTMEHYGRIDVLVNNAGVMQVGPVETMTIEDFETAMDVMFWGTVYTTLAVLPEMRKLKESRIVNITSVGAKVSVPHLLPYSCAKFAGAAFSQGMRAELQGTGVKVVTIAPGLMRTGSYLNPTFKGNEAGEAAWFGLSGSLPGISMSANRAARQIVAATRRGSAERILSTPANILTRFHGLLPGTTADLLGAVNRALPESGEDSGPVESVLRKPWFRAATLLGRLAAEEFLQPAARRFEARIQ